MATYEDVCVRVRALLDDVPNKVYTSSFLVPYVNQAQQSLAAELLAHGVNRMRVRMREPLLVKAGVTRISRSTNTGSSSVETQDPVFAPYANLFVTSDGNGIAAGADTTAWRQSPLTTVLTSGIADPFGGTTASQWVDPSTSSYSAFRSSTLTFTELSASGSVLVTNMYISFSGWFRVDTAGPGSDINLTIEPGSSTGTVFTSLNAGVMQQVDGQWRRLSATFGPFDVTAVAPERPSIRLTLTTGQANVRFILDRVTMSQLSFDPGDVYTTGTTTGAFMQPGLPPNFLEPDTLWEKTPGDTDDRYAIMSGARGISDFAPGTAQSLLFYDWRDNQIMFPSGCTRDRLIRMDYWCSLDDFPSTIVSNVQVDLPVNTEANALAFLTAGLAAHARGQSNLAAGYGIATPDGITGMAGHYIAMIVTAEMRSQNGVVSRRRPYFGYAPYPSGLARRGYPYYVNP